MGVFPIMAGGPRMKKYKNVKIKTKSGDVIELYDCCVLVDDVFFAIENEKTSFVVVIDNIDWIRKQECDQ